MSFHRNILEVDFDVVSQEVSIVCNEEEDRTRQEFKEDCDVNVLLQRNGVISSRQPVYGEWDDSVDLQSLQFQQLEAYNALPEGLREQFPNWASIVDALAAGRLFMAPAGVADVPSASPGGASQGGDAPAAA